MGKGATGRSIGRNEGKGRSARKREKFKPTVLIKKEKGYINNREQFEFIARKSKKKTGHPMRKKGT